MADEDHREARVASLSQIGQELVRPVPVQRRRRLVQYEQSQPRIENRARDLHHLTFSQTQCAGFYPSPHPILGEYSVERPFDRSLSFPSPTNTAKGGREFQQDVFGHREIGTEGKLLMHHSNTEGSCLLR